MVRNKVLSINKVFLITVIFSILGSYINGFILTLTDNYFVILLTSQIILILPSVIYLIQNKVNPLKAIRFKKMRVSNILLVILFGMLIIPVMTLINAISMLFVENTTSTFMVNIVENNGLLLSLCIVAFIPAVLEESVYRGIFYNEYRKANPLQAIFLSAFLFGIIHLNFNQFAYAFAMGIIFALIIEATDSILSSMIIHFVINGTSIVTLYIYPKLIGWLNKIYNLQVPGENFDFEQYINERTGDIDQILDISFIMESYFLPAVICAILAFIVYRTIATNTGRWEHIKSIFKGNQKKEKLISPSLVLGIIICIGLMVLQEIG